MKIPIQNIQQINLRNVMRRAGYHEFYDRKTRQSSFSKRLSGDQYPRFHAYLNEQGEQYFLNLHLDQKKASYKGYTAHSGEYDSGLVEREAERLKTFLN